MDAEGLFRNILKKRSFLCVGLDTELTKIPRVLMEEAYPVFEFNKRIIDATADLCIAYKPNLAFYESLGAAGWMSLEMTVNYIREHYPDQFVIADAKRGDIGNTSRMYANAFFKNMSFDALTVVPYMGSDSVSPFLEYNDHWVILLALTSNKGADDFQKAVSSEGEPLFQQVLHKGKEWGNINNMMFVVGATQADHLQRIREIVPEHFLLIPGIGAQGGNLKEVAENGMNKHCGLIINASRSIIYADGTNHFDMAAREQAMKIQNEMAVILDNKGFKEIS